MNTMIQIPELWVPIVSTFIPLLAALSVKRTPEIADPSRENFYRAAVAITASGVVAIAETLTDGMAGDTVNSILSSFFLAVATQLVFYMSLWRNLDINDKALPTKGIV